MMTFTSLRVRAFWYIREYISWQTNLYVLRKTSELKSKCFKSWTQHTRERRMSEIKHKSWTSWCWCSSYKLLFYGWKHLDFCESILTGRTICGIISETKRRAKAKATYFLGQKFCMNDLKAFLESILLSYSVSEIIYCREIKVMNGFLSCLKIWILRNLLFKPGRLKMVDLQSGFLTKSYCAFHDAQYQSL